MLGKPDGVFFLSADQVPADDKVLLSAAARAVLGVGRGSLAEQIERRRPRPPSRRHSDHQLDVHNCHAESNGPLMNYGSGTVSADSHRTAASMPSSLTASHQAGPTLPPAPWTNVLANPGFGCLVTEAGLGYSWAGNSQMNRLTPWSNDPASDPPGEAVYLRDEETGHVWTPTPLPLGDGAVVTVRHGQGYSRFAPRSQASIKNCSCWSHSTSQSSSCA